MHYPNPAFQPRSAWCLLKLLLLAFFLLGTISTWSQSGDFILTHHAPKHSEIDNVNFEIAADNNGIICIANRFGVLKYDGLEWGFYRTSSSALSLAISTDNTVYVGCLGGFGKLDFVDFEYKYVPLLEEETIEDHFLQTFAVKNQVYFLSDRSLYYYHPDSSSVDKIASGNFLNGYISSDRLHVNTEDDEVFVVSGKEMGEIANPERLWGIISKSPKGQFEFGVDLEGGLHRSENGTMKPHFHYDRLQEAEAVISDLEWVNDSLIACSTVESGVFFLHATDSNYFEVTDYHSGLPDNEIHDIYADNNQGVWVAHEFGLTRIAPMFPASSYSHFPGLEGNLIEAQRIKDDLWINTSLGVYYFSQDTSFRSRVYVEKVRKKQTRRSSQRRNTAAPTPTPEPEAAQVDTTQVAEEEPDKKKKKKRGFLRGLFKKKDRANEAQKGEAESGSFKQLFSSNEPSGQPASPAASSSSTRSRKQDFDYVRRVEKIVTGVSYQFRHVPGTDGKFRQLIGTQDRILATSHTGIYELTKESAELVINDPVQYVFAVPNSNRLLVSTEDGLLKYYELVDDIWTVLSSQYFEDAILNVYMDHLGHVWLAGTTHIYQGEFFDGVFEIQHSYEINNRFYDELSIWEHNEQLYFINSQGYFKLDREKDRIVPDFDLKAEIGTPHHHLHNERSRVWVYNGKIWHLLSPDGADTEFQYLGIFPNLKYINYDEVLDRYWLITDDNQLLAYSNKKIPGLQESYPIFLKRLVGKDGDLRVKKKIQFSHDQNSLTVELLKPDYIGFLNPEYQYKLNGLNQDWSKWTHANLIDYSYLPPNDYELMVRVRDALGNVEEASILSFSVETPYWQMPWFYAVQVFILGIVIIIASRLDEKKTFNRIVKHGLSILTLVVIIQFAQSVFTALFEIESTPVVEFLIDVSVALFVFPLEWLLRGIFLGEGLSLRKGKKKATT